MYQGATALLLILSFAHSHAKFFVSWFIAPEKSQNDNDRWSIQGLAAQLCGALLITIYTFPGDWESIKGIF